MPDVVFQLLRQLLRMAVVSTEENEWAAAYNITCSWAFACINLNSGSRATNVNGIQVTDKTWLPSAADIFGVRHNLKQQMMKMDLRGSAGLVAFEKQWPIFMRTNYILACAIFAWHAMHYLGGPELEEAVLAATEDVRFEEEEGDSPDEDGDYVAHAVHSGPRAYLFPNFTNNQPDYTRQRKEPYTAIWQKAAAQVGATGDLSSKCWRRALPVWAQAMNVSPHHTAQQGAWESTAVMASSYEDSLTYFRREQAARAMLGMQGAPMPGASSITLPIIPWKVTSGFTLKPPAGDKERRQYMTTSILHLALGEAPPSE